jgi:hypothetical protein
VSATPAQSGAEYIEPIKKRLPCVYLGGRSVTDVTAEPVFQEPIRPVARRPNGHLPRNIFACRISGRSLSAFSPSVTSWE